MGTGTHLAKKSREKRGTVIYTDLMVTTKSTGFKGLIMKKKLSALILLTVNMAIFSAVPPDYLPLAKSTHFKWEADSLFIGASAVVLSDTTPVIVKWKATYVQCLGKLFFIFPDDEYLPQLLFHNIIDSFPNEQKEINLGKFPQNTELYFMYIVVDTSQNYQRFRDKKLYSGPNRDSVDRFVSDLWYVHDKKWAVAGKIDSTRIEMGFSDGYTNMQFNAIMFEVSGVKIKRYLPTTIVFVSSDHNANQQNKDPLQHLYSISGKKIILGKESVLRPSFPKGFSGKDQISVFRIDGRKILTIRDNSAIVNFKNLGSGMYMIHATDGLRNWNKTFCVY